MTTNTTAPDTESTTRLLDELETIHRRYNSPHVEDLFAYLDAVEELLRRYGRPPLDPARWENAVAVILAGIDSAHPDRKVA